MKRHADNLITAGGRDNYDAVSLSGKLKEYSTAGLHRHPFHQVLMIRNGISLLVDETAQKPLYGTMCSFIPAGINHRTVVIGEQVHYQSLYIREDLYKPRQRNITIFSISELGSALFGRLGRDTLVNLNSGIMKECLSLFLRILDEDIASPTRLVHFPVTENETVKKIISFIEKNYNTKIELQHFRSVLPYTTRHIARIFKNELSLSIFEYIRLYRIFMSTVLLMDRHMSIVEAAYGCGYESLSGFYKDFKNCYGITPKRFRHRL